MLMDCTVNLKTFRHHLWEHLKLSTKSTKCTNVLATALINVLEHVKENVKDHNHTYQNNKTNFESQLKSVPVVRDIGCMRKNWFRKAVKVEGIKSCLKRKILPDIFLEETASRREGNSLSSGLWSLRGMPWVCLTPEWLRWLKASLSYETEVAFSVHNGRPSTMYLCSHWEIGLNAHCKLRLKQSYSITLEWMFSSCRYVYCSQTAVPRGGGGCCFVFARLLATSRALEFLKFLPLILFTGGELGKNLIWQIEGLRKILEKLWWTDRCTCMNKYSINKLVLVLIFKYINIWVLIAIWNTEHSEYIHKNYTSSIDMLHAVRHN